MTIKIDDQREQFAIPAMYIVADGVATTTVELSVGNELFTEEIKATEVVVPIGNEQYFAGIKDRTFVAIAKCRLFGN